MAGQKFTLTFDAQLNINQMKGALANIQGELGKLQLPSNISQNFTKVINNLSKEISNFEVLTSKDLTDPKQFKQIEASADKILNLYKLIQVQIKDLGNVSDTELTKLFPASVTKQIEAGEKAVSQYVTSVGKLEQKVKSAEESLKIAQDKLAAKTAQLQAQQKIVDDLKNNKITTTPIDQIAKQNGVKAEIQDYNDLVAKLKEAEEELQNYYKAVEIGKGNEGGRAANAITEAGLKKRAEALRATKEAYDQEQTAIKNQEDALKKAEKTLANYKGSVTKAQNSIQELTVTLERLKQEAEKGSIDALNDLFKELENNGFDTSGFERSVDGAKRAIEDFERTTGEGIRTATDQAREGINNQAEAFKDNAHAAGNATEANKDFMNQMNEVDQIKSRIQYFFGLSNAINLVRRAMRDAYETIKELDKAMTETAVVTDFSVGDMWAQLPEYTQRANELGVSTKAAYEAATLYYQQGLKTNEVMAMSNETLKMARIAGLDAAVATDRMTNAIRGFNMEINTTNAQRIDDVYSKLAAISASNVDEISTAMTKVASLAHSANMEFETTAAFLAQIIETTRESAETAGTALKTVVARFSEVKKLVDEGKLSGEDEEGEVIDVNKVSAALRTAGVDLNKYFLGQVGLDDIFMELASKWKNLTQLQQRYIATQAAGSRQQSRFIALMSDYARTQELVGEAYNANGAAAEQFNKTQESLESKLARLKNAWDEFTMGLLNSDLTKGIVDLLTNILNGVNQLTSGFGSLNNGVGGVINSVLKLSTLLMSLRLGKGIVTGLGKGLAGTAAAGGAEAVGGFKILGPIAGLKTLGAGAAGGLKTLGAGLFKPLASLATTIAPLLPALGAIAAAATVAYIAIKKLYDASPAGQIKIAEKYAAQLHEMTDAAKKEKQQLEAVQQEYSRLSEAVDNAANIQEKTEAVKARNDYIKSLLEENEIYAQYINHYEVKDGQIYLTIDEDALQKALDRVSEEAIRRQAREDVSNANVAYKQYQEAVRRVEELKEELNNYNYYYNTLEGRSRIQQFEADQWGNWSSYQSDYGAAISAYDLYKNPQELDFIKDRIAIAEESAARLREKYQSFIGQATLGFLNDNEYESYTDEQKNLLAHIIEKSDVSDLFETLLNKYLTTYKSRNNDTIVSNYKDIYGRDAVLPTTKDGEIDYEALRNQLAFDDALNEIEEKNKVLIEKIPQLAPALFNALEDLLLNSGQNIRYDELSNYFPVYLANTLEEIWDLFPEELQKQLKIKGANLTTDLADAIGGPLSEIFDREADYDSYLDLFKLINKLATEFKLTINQTRILSKTFTDFATDNYNNLNDLEGGAKGFISFITDLISNINDDELKEQVFAAFDVLDTDSAASIDQFFGALEALGVDFSKVEGGAEGAAKRLKELANVKDPFDMEGLKTQVEDAISTIWDIRGRKSTQSGYRTFSQDEYQVIEDAVKALGKEADINLDDIFRWTGIKNKEWNFVGEDLERLVQLLIDGLNGAIGKAQDYLEGPEWFETFSTALGNQNKITTLEGDEATLEEVLRTIAASPDFVNKLSSDDIKKIRDLLVSLGFDWAQTLTPKGLSDIISEALANYDQFRADQENQPEIDRAVSSVDYLTPINELYQRPGGISSERYQSAVEGKFAVDEHAEDRFESILRSIQQIDAANAKWNKTAEQQRTIAQALSVNWSETAAKLTELTEILNKNDKILYEGSKESYEYSGAIHAVGEAMRAVYGEQVSDEFVEAHIQQIVLARESKEAYQELLNILQQDFFSNAKQTGNEFEQQLWALQQAMFECGAAASQLDGLELDGVAILDGSPWMDVIKQLWGNLDAFEAYLATCGWTLVLGETDPTTGLPKSASLVRNQPTGYGGYQPYTGSNWGRGSSGRSGNNEPKETRWRSDFDWLYNLMEDITELQREQTKLQEEQNKILEVGNSEDTGKDLYENLVKQLGNLNAQKAFQSGINDYRNREMQEFMAANAQYGGYFRFNDIDKTLEINWDAINAIGDKETYDKVKELVSQAEAIQKKMDDSEDAVRKVEQQIRALENIWRDQYVDFEKRVLDALVKSYQRVIDNYSDLHDTVTQANNDILDALQKEIALERQIRDNTKTEDQIADTEARLAFLRRDTTGGNQVSILAAQKELEESRQQYEDTLIDQAISRLQEDNDDASRQREKQIELMQAHLDYAVQSGEFNDAVYDLISRALGGDGELLTDSELMRLLQQEESWSAMSETSRQVWEDELQTTFKEVSAYLLKEKSEADGTFAADIQRATIEAGYMLGASLENGLQQIGWNIGSLSQALEHVTYAFQDAINEMASQAPVSTPQPQPQPQPGQTTAGAALGTATTISKGYQVQWGIDRYGTGYTVTKNGVPYPTPNQGAAYEVILRDLEQVKMRGYKTGGLATQTGLAWLDGTPSEPEYVLNARQTDAFLRLADVLPAIFDRGSTSTNNVGGTMYLDVNINVESISDDYDVDQLVERVKDNIYSAASYRNVNIVNLSR